MASSPFFWVVKRSCDIVPIISTTSSTPQPLSMLIPKSLRSWGCCSKRVRIILLFRHLINSAMRLISQFTWYWSLRGASGESYVLFLMRHWELSFVPVVSSAVRVDRFQNGPWWRRPHFWITKRILVLVEEMDQTGLASWGWVLMRKYPETIRCCLKKVTASRWRSHLGWILRTCGFLALQHFGRQLTILFLLTGRSLILFETLAPSKKFSAVLTYWLSLGGVSSVNLAKLAGTAPISNDCS